MCVYNSNNSVLYIFFFHSYYSPFCVVYLLYSNVIKKKHTLCRLRLTVWPVSLWRLQPDWRHSSWRAHFLVTNVVFPWLEWKWCTDMQNWVSGERERWNLWNWNKKCLGLATMSDSQPRRTPTFWTPLVFSPDVAVVVVVRSLTSEALKTIGEWCGCNRKSNWFNSFKNSTHNVRQRYKGKCYWLDTVELKCHEEYLYSCRRSQLNIARYVELLSRLTLHGWLDVVEVDVVTPHHLDGHQSQDVNRGDRLQSHG